MHKPLYLDTARLGQMSPRACRASIDFSRFAAEYGCDLYLSQLLMHGFERWPKWLRDSFPGLSDWQGVSGLKNRLRMAASRMRSRYRELLREEISQTLSSQDDVEDEIRSLFAAFES